MLLKYQMKCCFDISFQYELCKCLSCVTLFGSNRVVLLVWHLQVVLNGSVFHIKKIQCSLPSSFQAVTLDIGCALMLSKWREASAVEVIFVP